MPSRLRPVLLLALLAGALVPAAAHARAVTGGELVVGRSAAGISLGMTRAEVARRLGRPFYKNANGYMQYAPDGADGGFDLYLTGTKARSTVRLIGILGGGDFTVDGRDLFAKGTLRALKARYGARMKRKRFEDGEVVWRISSTSGGRRTYTDFSSDARDQGLDGRVIQVFLGVG